MGTEVKPVILPEGDYTKKEVAELIAAHNPSVVDIYADQLLELYEILHPSLTDIDSQKTTFLNERGYQSHTRGSWVYFPWNNNLLHILSKDDLFTVKTNRNRHLITADEQKVLRSCHISIAGLSVGNSIALSLAYSGIGDSYTLADHDVFSTANMNRVRIRLSDVLQKKTDITAQQMYECNPYLQIKCMSAGVSTDNMAEFFESHGKKQMVFEEIDDFKMKMHLRIEAQKRRQPFVMLTALGDSILIDIERHDTEPETQIFNGLVDAHLTEEVLTRPIDEETKKRYAVQLVGREYVPKRAFDSLKDIGVQLVGRPQLYGTVSMDGGFAPYIARKIFLGQELKSGRYRMALDEIMSKILMGNQG